LVFSDDAFLIVVALANNPTTIVPSFGSVDNVRIAYLNRQRFSGATAADQFLRIMQVEQPKT